MSKHITTNRDRQSRSNGHRDCKSSSDCKAIGIGLCRSCALKANRKAPVKISHNGERYGRITILSECPASEKNHRYVRCKCDCGTLKNIALSSLRSGAVKSCGCLAKEASSRRAITHGMSKLPEFRIWHHVKQRCYNKNASGWSQYGGRGIKVCDRWRESFAAFYADMGQRPSPRYSIDRIDNNGDYKPENCRWATQLEQTQNMQKTTYVVFNGERISLAKLYYQGPRPITYLAVRSRIRLGWPVGEALSTPKHQRRCA